MRKRQVGRLPCLENCCRFSENKRKEMFISLYISLLILATCETAFLRTVCIWSDRAVLCLFTLKMCLMSSALLCSWETPRSWYIQFPGSCYSYRNFSVADLKKSIENAQVEHKRCRPWQESWWLEFGAEVEKSKAGRKSGDCKASLEITTNVLVSWGPNISAGVDTEKTSSVLFEFMFMFRIP